MFEGYISLYEDKLTGFVICNHAEDVFHTQRLVLAAHSFGLWETRASHDSTSLKLGMVGVRSVADLAGVFGWPLIDLEAGGFNPVRWEKPSSAEQRAELGSL